MYLHKIVSQNFGPLVMYISQASAFELGLGLELFRIRVLC